MELPLITLLLLVLFVQYGGRLKDDLRRAIGTNPSGVIKYFGSAAVLSVALSSLPGVLLSIYMRNNGFFAFELFGERQHAFQVLSLNVFFNLLVVSLYFFAVALLWSVNAGKIAILLGFVLSLFIVVLFLAVAISSGRYELFASIIVFCTVLGLYLCFWVSHGFDAKANLWWIPLVTSGVLLFLPMLFYGPATTFTESALSQMRVGGMTVELFDPLQSKDGKPMALFTGRLLLRTPEFYYVRTTGDRESVLVISTEHLSLKYKDLPVGQK